MHAMVGDLAVMDRTVARAGFLHPALHGGYPAGMAPGPSYPIYSRALPALSPEHQEFLGTIQRGEVTGDVGQIQMQLGLTLNELVRGISTGLGSNFPVRENLEAVSKILVPTDTPVRNMLPRRMGSGLASAWFQTTSLGGGWGSTASDPDQPGGGSKVRAFFSELISGSQAPAEHTSVYLKKSASYRLMGTFGSITGFAMAAGANYMNQLSVEKNNALVNMMLNEEFALIHGVASGSDDYGNASTAAPWGDGTNALAFDGLSASIATANGTPSAHIQTSVGALTLSHIDAQLRRIWIQGGKSPWILVNSQEAVSLVHLAEASGSIIRVQANASGGTVLGVSVTGYVHPITGEVVPIYASRFLKAGVMLFGCKYLPDGSPAADVDVLPQVQLPELAPTDNVMGYTAQELAPTISAPQVYPFIITTNRVFRMKGATVFGKSSGLTPV